MKIFQTTQFKNSFYKLQKKKNQYAGVNNEVDIYLSQNTCIDSVNNSEAQSLKVLNGFIFYKLRLPNNKMNCGKSGGYRLIFMISADGKYMVLLEIYPKTGKLAQSSLKPNGEEILLKGFVEDSKNKTLSRYNLL